jgi:hypothetical protein
MISIITNYKMNDAVGTIKIIKKGAYILSLQIRKHIHNMCSIIIVFTVAGN